ncbi:hypothetical protein CsSME_00050608 [Camellia sinensis var. sinensis]
MDLFRNAKAVRLRSHHDKYLLADDDEDFVTQDRNGSAKNARWTVEFVDDDSGRANFLRLKSCFGKYLTALNQPFLLAMTGHKVVQSSPAGRFDSSVEWEPIREGNQGKLKTKLLLIQARLPLILLIFYLIVLDDKMRQNAPRTS